MFNIKNTARGFAAIIHGDQDARHYYSLNPCQNEHCKECDNLTCTIEEVIQNTIQQCLLAAQETGHKFYSGISKADKEGDEIEANECDLKAVGAYAARDAIRELDSSLTTHMSIQR